MQVFENLTSNRTQVISLDVQTNSNAPAKEPSFWYIMPELLSDSDGIHEEVEES